MADIGEDLEKAKKKSHDVQVDFSNRVGKLEGHSTAFPWVAGVVLAAITIIMAITIAGGREVYLMNGRLSGIEITVNAIRLAQVSDNSQDPKNAKEAKRVLTEARSAKIKIPQDVIESAGKKFVDSGQDYPEAWSAAIALVEYRSFLNDGQSPSLAGLTPEPMDMSGYMFLAVVGKRPEIIRYGQVPEAKAAVLEPLNRKLNKNLTHGNAFIVVNGGVVALDQTDMRHVIFNNTRIRYHGGPLNMEDVYFVNCTFEIEPQPKGRSFANAILTSPSTTFNAT